MKRSGVCAAVLVIAIVVGGAAPQASPLDPVDPKVFAPVEINKDVERESQSSTGRVTYERVAYPWYSVPGYGYTQDEVAAGHRYARRSFRYKHGNGRFDYGDSVPGLDRQKARLRDPASASGKRRITIGKRRPGFGRDLSIFGKIKRPSTRRKVTIGQRSFAFGHSKKGISKGKPRLGKRWHLGKRRSVVRSRARGRR